MPRCRVLPALLAICLSCAPGCRDEAAEQASERRDAAQATLDLAPEGIRLRISETCERWQDTSGQCDADLVYASVLDCWVEKGLPQLEATLENDIRPRSRQRRVVMHHSVCMEKQGWRLVPGSGGHF